MKDNKERFLDSILVLLVALLLVQSGLLWMDSGRQKSTSTLAAVDTSRLERNLIRPSQMIVNIGNHHYKTPFFDMVYGQLETEILQRLDTVDLKSLETVDRDTYMNYQYYPSLVFRYASRVPMGTLLNLLGTHQNEPFALDEIYLAENQMIITSAGTHYVVANPPKLSSDLLSANTMTYKNFNERYQVKKNLYVPDSVTYPIPEITYATDMSGLMRDDAFVGNLSTQFFQKDIEHIRDLEEDTQRTLVYENQFLYINDRGTIEFEDASRFSSPQVNLHTSFTTALEFVADKVANSGLYLSAIEPVTFEGNQGYRFTFDRLERNIPVVMMEDDAHYVELEVYNTHIRRFRQNHRVVAPAPKETSRSLIPLSLDTILSRNSSTFGPSVAAAMTSIANVGISYLDDTLSGDPDLRPAIYIDYNNRRLYFNPLSGRLIMER
ncbi:hypothetical protein O6R05_00375 [Peptoniphilus equinus]|uniref:Regulatory protein YycH domain-containing protein n=1 Tax=Peptoniphilus equinus TaxID=3016343 RepID=A0ABY7QUV3_9FIRM|nr:hypothetical protein [Peptoniphilus equinus]WBW50055.1 hypothetical protein O6R05_00375 [Peptoniphilus equinus]